MNTVTVPNTTKQDKEEEITSWLKENAGFGSARYGGKEGHIRHWLNGDDWLYYNQWVGEFPGTVDDLDTTSTVFVFRDEKIATEFALRFA